MTKYLDENGLAYFWTKIKAWLSSHAPVKYFGQNWVEDTNDDYALVVGNGADENNPNDSLKITHDGDIVIGDHSGRNTTIYHQAENRLGDAIVFLSNPTDATGDGIKIGNGGLVVIGSGESSDAIIQDESLTPGSEDMYIASDSSLLIRTGCGTITNKRRYRFTADGCLDVFSRIPQGTTPSEETCNGMLRFLDSNNASFAQIQDRVYTSGSHMTWFQAYNAANNVWNSLGIGFDSNNIRSIQVTDAGAWRKALGLGKSDGSFPLTIAQGGSGQTSLGWTTTYGDVLSSVASGITITRFACAWWGEIVFLRVEFKRNAAFSVGANGDTGNTSLFRIKPAYCPTYYTWARSNGDSGMDARVLLSYHNADCSLLAFEGTGSARTIAANTAIEIAATYMREVS